MIQITCVGADAKGLLLVATENAVVDATVRSIRIVSLYLNNCCTYKKKKTLLILDVSVLFFNYTAAKMYYYCKIVSAHAFPGN